MSGKKHSNSIAFSCFLHAYNFVKLVMLSFNYLMDLINHSLYKAGKPKSKLLLSNPSQALVDCSKQNQIKLNFLSSKGKIFT